MRACLATRSRTPQGLGSARWHPPTRRRCCASTATRRHRNIARSYRERGYGLAALCRASLAEPIGFAGLTHPGGQSEAELKYALAPPYWGQGYASEAAAALLDFGLRTVGLARIIATVDTVHTASVQVLDKIGMRRVEERVDAEGYAEFLYERRALAGSP